MTLFLIIALEFGAIGAAIWALGHFDRRPQRRWAMRQPSVSWEYGPEREGSLELFGEAILVVSLVLLAVYLFL
ncbi:MULTISPECIES: hypothetical protein [Pseudomonas]|uniref:Uncharacterized protein n=1 Tax=Pseudomonas asplenii TaxID=53407 RepID=A0A0M9GHG9_9PSED|nr:MULTISPECIES: hypothetical protein [Pseudomonas]KPA91317.1 hypothetical protein PF66_02200 [Pseudomonas fuscovaginae]KPA95205.1 hypothetical protein PF70_04790 [Pseudomonas fuscovaginae]